jgi:hypothetical protein
VEHRIADQLAPPADRDARKGRAAFYTLQLSAMSRLQPHVQILWDNALSRDAAPTTVFQFQ